MIFGNLFSTPSNDQASTTTGNFDGLAQSILDTVFFESNPGEIDAGNEFENVVWMRRSDTAAPELENNLLSFTNGANTIGFTNSQYMKGVNAILGKYYVADVLKHPLLSNT